MDKTYWENIAPSYDAEIFDVFENDKKKIIAAAIEKSGSKKKRVMDIGCGIGKWLPLLSEHFGTVYAVDISQKNIEIAQQLHADLTNIEYIRTDVGRSRPIRCNVALCINALLTPSLKKRAAFLQTLSESLVTGGRLILVTPALESALLSELMLAYWHEKDGTTPATYTGADAGEKWHNLKQGVVELDGVPTKHFLKEELAFVLREYRLEILQTTKIEYGWHTEYTDPPAWLADPWPWDWMVVARKTK